jgi:hypothetical protein
MHTYSLQQLFRYSDAFPGSRDNAVGIATTYGLEGPEIESQQITVAELSKERVRVRSLDEVAGSNPSGGMDVCVISCK